MTKRYCPQCEHELRIENLATTPHEVIGRCTNCTWTGPLKDFLLEFQPSRAKASKSEWTPYVSIDLETTGLDEEECQVLEFGAVIDNWHSPLDQLPRFQSDVFPSEGYISGQPYALAMNRDILARLSKGSGEPENTLGMRFAEWLKENNVDPLHVTAAGKNFASFDLQFLKRIPGFSDYVRFKHRAIDPAIFYWRPDTDENLPSTQVCLNRAGFPDHVAHTAVEDCLTVIRLIRRGVRKCQLCVSDYKTN